MLHYKAILASLLCTGFCLSSVGANAMDAGEDWQLKQVQRNLDQFNRDLAEAESKHDEKEANSIRAKIKIEEDHKKLIEDDLERARRGQKARGAVPPAQHNPRATGFKQQTRADEEMAVLMQRRINEREARLKAARLAEEERLSQIALDKERHDQGLPAPVHNIEEDAALARRIAAELEAEAAAIQVLRKAEEERLSAARLQEERLALEEGLNQAEIARIQAQELQEEEERIAREHSVQRQQGNAVAESLSKAAIAKLHEEERRAEEEILNQAAIARIQDQEAQEAHARELQQREERRVAEARRNAQQEEADRALARRLAQEDQDRAMAERLAREGNGGH